MNNKWKIPMFKTHWEESNIQAVEKVIRRGTYWATGPEISEFENKLQEFNGVKYAVTFNSGTSALHAMYAACGLEGKEVIVPSFTFIATANAVELAGGKPVFAESEMQTYGLDAEDVESRITSQTGAIVALHYSGCPSRDIFRLKELALKHQVMLLEDNAHSLGARTDGQMTGTFGQAAALSFCQNKLISTGEGGAVLTNARDIYEKLLLLRSHGRTEINPGDYFSVNSGFEYTVVGYNYRMPTMCAALGLSQLENFELVIKKRTDAAHYITEGLKDIKEIVLPEKMDQSDHYFQQYTIRLENQDIRDSLKGYLTNDGIFSNIYYKPIHLESFYRDKYGWKPGDLPQTEMISNTILTIPMFPDLTQQDMDLMIHSIRSFFQDRNNG